MNPTPDERDAQRYYYPQQGNRGKGTTRIALIAVAVIILAAGAWWLSRPAEQPPEQPVQLPEPVTETAPQPELAPPAPEPAVIETPPPEPEPALPEPEPVKLPALDSSDQFVRDTALALSDNPAHKEWLQADNLARRATAILDGISRGQLIHKFVPVKPPKGKFKADKQGKTLTVSSDNYRRYNQLIDNLTAIEPQQLADAIRNLQPLLASAFGEQGHPDRTYRQMLEEAIDELLATPSYQQPPELLLESVYYKFKEPAIESLSDVQKQLIRSGPDNTRKLQDYLRRLKSELKDISPAIQ